MSIDSKKYVDAITILGIVYSVLGLTLGFLAFFRIIQAMEKERIAWFKMIRLVPGTLISRDKMLKGYLVKNSKGVLGLNY